MILYDQDFNFIGMSAENLTFLGYEDIDEFTSMHNDFADLFVKREGLIHKFENFSWIHFILYSGSPNKRACVRHKNGTEIPVELSINEIFLTQAYDGLRKIYSVKLINEAFAKNNEEESDAHEATPQQPHFTLKNLTKDLDIPDENSTFASSIHAISESDEEEEREEDAPSPQLNERDFILNIPPLPESRSDTTTESESESEDEVEEHYNHIDFDATPPEPKVEERGMLDEKSRLFEFNLLTEDSNSASTPQEQEPKEPQKSEEEVAIPFSFDLFKKEMLKESEAEEVQTQEESEKSFESEKNEALIDHIKSDIAEIDADLPTDPDSQKESEEALCRIVNQQKEESHTDKSSENDRPIETLQEQQRFENTLKEIFSFTAEERQKGTDEKPNVLNFEEEKVTSKQPITKEPIKSQTDHSAEEEKLILPTLGNLGLSKEEEIDFIEEFLEDTEATILLMESYLKLEDFDNIKYSLIKISSSAEILHFDHLLEATRSLRELCEAKASHQIAEKFEILKKLISRYKEHFSTIIA